jgi:serine/threonine-protein kinase
MDAARWERIQELFNAALELAEPRRKAYVRKNSGDDAELARVVESMLNEEQISGSVLDRDISAIASAILDDETQLPPQTTFGPYRITGTLGSGGMGVVYRAERDDIGSHAAVKILRDAWLSPARRLRFASEQRTLARLSHDSIARLYDAGTMMDGTPWFVMEYVDGTSLTHYCDANRCTVRERLQLFRQACDAVLYAHANAVIHRDLKPSNILVTREGEIKLLDFGIAKQLDPAYDEALRTQTMMRLMTPAYAAPEQLRGGNVGIQTDVYSLGVILYELLAGELPFDLSRCTPAEAERMVLDRDPVRPSAAFRRSVDTGHGARHEAPTRSEWSDLDVLCLTAMHKDTAHRYRSVEALVRDVDNYLNGIPLDARPDTIGYVASKFLHRNRRAVLLAAAILLLLGSVASVYTMRLRRERAATLAEAARTQRVQAFMLNLLKGGDPSAAPAESLTVLTLVDRGAREANSLSADPLVQAELYATLGGIYQGLGQLDRADALLGRALSTRHRVLGDSSAAVAESMIALGMLRSDQARYDDAERLVQTGLAIDRKTLRQGHPAIAAATAALGTVLEARGSYAGAIKALGDAVAMETANGDTGVTLNETLSELANTHFYLGHYATSDSINRRVLANSIKLYGGSHPAVANDLINLGAIQTAWGHNKAAEQYYRRALAINEAWYGPDNAEIASDLTMLARTLIADSRAVEAGVLLDRALATNERVYGSSHPRVASTLNEIGTVALQRKEYAKAAGAFARMLAIYKSVYGDKHYLIALATANLGSVYMAQGNYQRAEGLFRDAARRYAAAQGPDHINTGIALVKLGRCLLRERRYAEAETQSYAAYQVLHKQIEPAGGFLRGALADLAAENDSLRNQQRAAHFRTELAQLAAADTAG